MKSIILLLANFLIPLACFSQIDTLIIEKYYVSGAGDTYDSYDSYLEEGSVTYRIYIDLAGGNKLLSVYGSEYHPLMFTSTAKFFNNSFVGSNLGYQFKQNFLRFGNAALDSWLTIGFATDSHQGVPKNQDPDGSIVGGDLNSDGMLVHEHPEVDIPLTSADGLMIDSANQKDFTVLGLVPASDFIFGDSTIDSVYLNTSGSMSSLSGVHGLNSDNRILVAQLTTLGEISFTLNIKVKLADGSTANYVGTSDTLLSGEIYSRYLSYPPSGGCTNPYFANYDPFASYDDGSCKDSVRFGCFDKAACNYDPEANFEVKELCCYGPDNCDNRDISIVCPNYEAEASLGFNLFPNPAWDDISIEIYSGKEENIRLMIMNSYGSIIVEKNIDNVGEYYIHTENVSSLKSGLYLVRINKNGKSISKAFLKE